MNDGLIEGPGQGSKAAACIKTKRIIGVGIYCTSKIDTAKGYTASFQFNGGNHLLILQCRVKPDAVRYAS